MLMSINTEIDKPRLWVRLQHRGSLTVGQKGQQLGPAAFHWSIMVSPKIPCGRESQVFDVSDGPVSGPPDANGVRLIVDQNPQHHWNFRTSSAVDPLPEPSLVLHIMIGKLEKPTTVQTVLNIVHNVPVPPTRDGKENCVTWAIAAVKALQARKLVESFDTDKLMADATRAGHAYIANPGSNPKIINYTSRRLRKSELARYGHVN
ncbi:hypothetical protein MMC18_008307 [Xylographa bjoerkii]|nr:hypothetical protein [Xylographa bjoerkii]